MTELYNIQVTTPWWESLSNNEKVRIMKERMIAPELRRRRYKPIKPDAWWYDKTWSKRSDIYLKYHNTYPQKKGRASRSKRNKRGVKK